jgi:hypothetical protein
VPRRISVSTPGNPQFTYERSARFADKQDIGNEYTGIHKIPFGPLAKPGDLFEDEHLNASGRLDEVRLAADKIAKLPMIPLDKSGTSDTARS